MNYVNLYNGCYSKNRSLIHIYGDFTNNIIDFYNTTNIKSLDLYGLLCFNPSKNFCMLVLTDKIQAKNCFKIVPVLQKNKSGIPRSLHTCITCSSLIREANIPPFPSKKPSTKANVYQLEYTFLDNNKHSINNRPCPIIIDLDPTNNYPYCSKRSIIPIKKTHRKPIPRKELKDKTKNINTGNPPEMFQDDFLDQFIDVVF